jgi:hypothetical protein
VTITNAKPWDTYSARVEVDGGDRPMRHVAVTTVDTSYFRLFGVRVLAGRDFNAADEVLPPGDRPVIVNRSFVAEMLRSGRPIGRRVRYLNSGDKAPRWMTIVGVVEDFPIAAKTPGQANGMGVYNLTTPGEWAEGQLTIRLRGQTPETFAPALRRIAASVDPMLQLSEVNSLDAFYREYARGAAQLVLVVALVTGSVLLLSAAGIHALMSFTVNQRRREIGIRSALGGSARLILTSVLARAARQLSVGVGVGLVLAVAMDLLAGGEMLEGAGLLLVPGTAVFMLVVGLIAALGPARRGLRVEPTEALRAE